jgi:hypothetical protein
MVSKRSRLAILICILVLMTVLVAISTASLVLWLVADWEKHAWALTLTVKIMWGSWAVLLTATLLTWVTIFGWKFRRPQPGQGPMALLRSIAAGEEPSAFAKTTGTSFVFTVVLVSLTGVAVLASVLLWILGNWAQFAGPLTLALKWIWGSWWVLVIATVLVRLAVFDQQRRNRKKPPSGTDGNTDKKDPPADSTPPPAANNE